MHAEQKTNLLPMLSSVMLPMHMCMYLKHIHHNYGLMYVYVCEGHTACICTTCAQDTTQSISHMHEVYVIHTSIYLYFYACIFVYLFSHRSCIKCIFACMPYTYRHKHGHMNWFRSMHMCMYVSVCLALTHTHKNVIILRWCSAISAHLPCSLCAL